MIGGQPAGRSPIHCFHVPSNSNEVFAQGDTTELNCFLKTSSAALVHARDEKRRR